MRPPFTPPKSRLTPRQVRDQSERREIADWRADGAAYERKIEGPSDEAKRLLRKRPKQSPERGRR
jgi:hypothetical protein